MVLRNQGAGEITARHVIHHIQSKLFVATSAQHLSLVSFPLFHIPWYLVLGLHIMRITPVGLDDLGGSPACDLRSQALCNGAKSKARPSPVPTTLVVTRSNSSTHAPSPITSIGLDTTQRLLSLNNL